MRYNLIQVSTILVVYSIQISAVIPSGATVQTRNGYKAIQDLEVGERVISINDRGDRLSRSAVMANRTAGRRNSTVEIYSYDSKLKACTDQSFYDPVKRKWVNAEDLNGENFLLNDRLESVRVMGIKRKSGIALMANAVTISRTHSLFVDGYLVHNTLGAFFAALGEKMLVAVGGKVIGDAIGNSLPSYSDARSRIEVMSRPEGPMSLVMGGSEEQRAPFVGAARRIDAGMRAEEMLMEPVTAHYLEPRLKEPSASQKYYESKAESERRYAKEMAQYELHQDNKNWDNFGNYIGKPEPVEVISPDSEMYQYIAKPLKRDNAQEKKPENIQEKKAQKQLDKLPEKVVEVKKSAQPMRMIDIAFEAPPSRPGGAPQSAPVTFKATNNNVRFGGFGAKFVESSFKGAHVSDSWEESSSSKVSFKATKKS